MTGGLVSSCTLYLLKLGKSKPLDETPWLTRQGRIRQIWGNRKILWLLHLQLAFIDFSCFSVTTNSNISSIWLVDHCHQEADMDSPKGNRQTPTLNHFWSLGGPHHTYNSLFCSPQTRSWATCFPPHCPSSCHCLYTHSESTEKFFFFQKPKAIFARNIIWFPRNANTWGEAGGTLLFHVLLCPWVEFRSSPQGVAFTHLKLKIKKENSSFLLAWI